MKCQCCRVKNSTRQVIRNGKKLKLCDGCETQKPPAVPKPKASGKRPKAPPKPPARVGARVTRTR